MASLATSDSPAKHHFGVYCLANDEALEWFQAFVRSFRKFHPTLPLTVIPYNRSMTKLTALQSQFAFSIMEEAAASRFDAIAHRVAGQNIPGGTFRKLTCFTGEYETFLFLDSDIVVTSDLRPLFEIFQASTADFVYFDTDLSMVYTPDFARQMVAEYGSPGFNSGAFLARRNSVSEAEIMVAVAAGEKIREHFSIWGEQPFLNYLMDTTRRRQVSAHTLQPTLAQKPWARLPFHYRAQTDQYVAEAGGLMPFIHWPGCEYPTMVRPEVFLQARTLGMSPEENRRYRRHFYYRRYLRTWKERLVKFKFFAKLFAWREALKKRGRRVSA